MPDVNITPYPSLLALDEETPNFRTQKKHV